MNRIHVYIDLQSTDPNDPIHQIQLFSSVLRTTHVQQAYTTSTPYLDPRNKTTRLDPKDLGDPEQRARGVAAEPSKKDEAVQGLYVPETLGNSSEPRLETFRRTPGFPTSPNEVTSKAIRAKRRAGRASREPGAESRDRPSLTAGTVCDLQQSDREGTPNQRALVSKGSCTPSSDQKSVSRDSAWTVGWYNKSAAVCSSGSSDRPFHGTRGSSGSAEKVLWGTPCDEKSGLVRGHVESEKERQTASVQVERYTSRRFVFTESPGAEEVEALELWWVGKI